MKVTFQAVKFWVLEPIMWTLAIIGLYVLLGLGEARAAPSPTPTQLRVHAASVELAHRLPTGMLAAVCEQESHWRNVSGQRGEIGVCQIMPDTVRMICNCGGVSTAWFQQGSKGPIVKQIQAELTHVGTYYDRIDGIYGPKTAQDFGELRSEMPPGVRLLALGSEIGGGYTRGARREAIAKVGQNLSETLTERLPRVILSAGKCSSGWFLSLLIYK